MSNYIRRAIWFTLLAEAESFFWALGNDVQWARLTQSENGRYCVLYQVVRP